MPRRLPERIRQEGRKQRRSKGRSYHSLPFQEAPIKEDEEIEVLIDDTGSKGDGLTRIKGFLTFVPQTKVGERLKVRIVKVGRKFAIAEKLGQTEEKN